MKLSSEALANVGDAEIERELDGQLGKFAGHSFHHLLFRTHFRHGHAQSGNREMVLAEPGGLVVR